MKTAFILCIAVQFLFLLEATNIHGKVDSADYISEAKDECHYWNGTQQVKFLRRLFYNQEEFIFFDSDKGYFIAKTELGRPDAEYWNKNKDIIDQLKAEVQRFCVPNYEVYEKIGIAGRRVKPMVKVSLMPHYEDSHSEHHMLVCNVYGFYPSKIMVKWYQNGEEKSSEVQSTDIFQNGDWTFKVLVMLEMEIKKGDNFTCEVHHKSLDTPIRINWQPQKSDSATNKVATGIVGFVLGTILVIAGVVVYMRGRKAQMSFRGPQTEHFIHS